MIKIKKYLKMINEGNKIKDKTSLFLYFLTRNKKLISPVIIKNKDGIFYCGDNMDRVWVASSFHELYLQDYFSLDKGVFVDIGSNVGKYTIKMANKLKNNGSVISIEAEKDNFDILKKSVELNRLSNIFVENCACSSKDGFIEFYLSKIPGHHSTKKSKYRDVVKTVKIKSKKLDTIISELGIKKVDFIKIDVEGGEVEVLEGAEKTLKTHPKIIFEAWDEEFFKKMENILSKYNYKIKKISETYYLAYN